MSVKENCSNPSDIINIRSLYIHMVGSLHLKAGDDLEFLPPGKIGGV